MLTKPLFRAALVNCKKIEPQPLNSLIRNQLMQRPIRSGSFGNIYRMNSRVEGPGKVIKEVQFVFDEKGKKNENEQFEDWKLRINQEAQYHQLFSDSNIGPSVPNQFYFHNDQYGKRYIVMESFLDYGDLGHFFRKNARFHPSVQRKNIIKLEELIRNLFQMSSLLKLKCSDQKPDNFLYKMNGDTLDKIVFTDFGVDFCCDYNQSCTVRRCKSGYPNPWIHAMVMMLQISVYAAIYNKTYTLFLSDLAILWIILHSKGDKYSYYIDQIKYLEQSSSFRLVFEHYTKDLIPDLEDLVKSVIREYDDSFGNRIKSSVRELIRNHDTMVIQYMNKYDMVHTMASLFPLIHGNQLSDIESQD